MRRVVCLLFLLSCYRKLATPEDDPTAVTVDEATAAIKKGSIGPDASGDSTYVLVDISNGSAADRLVTVVGQLVGTDGSVVGSLGFDEIRVPTKATRTFALVADKVAPDGAKPRLQVTHAFALDYPPQIEISDRQDKKGDLFVATAKARNLVERTASTVLACTFYDASGKILSRPFTIVELAPGIDQTLRFEGPKAAMRAVVFTGQVAFKQ